MKRLCSPKNSAKKGVVSLYIVIFATILFGVVTLSFMRIIVSEASHSSDDDLSRSAYDAAMAGVEDAKTAVNQYYDCLSRGGTADGCRYSTLFRDSCDSDHNGIGLAEYLYGYTTGEVKLQQNGVFVGNDTDNDSDQAYTCVVLRDHVPDYRGTLTSDTRTKVVPIRIQGGTGTGGGTTAAARTPISRIRFQWFSGLNEGASTGAGADFRNLTNDKKLPNYNNATTPPTIQLTLIKVGDGDRINLDDMRHSNNTGSVTYSTFVLKPSSQTSGGGHISDVIGSAEISNAGNTSAGQNEPIPITCHNDTEFACTLDMQSVNIGANDTAFLVVSLPYGDTISDFAVSLHTSDNVNDNTTVEFYGVQISVDSTGRTNQLVRRVESRLDPADLYFPYPQYEIEADGTSGGDNIHKSFWITANCWHSHPTEGMGATSCANNKEITNATP